MTTNRYRHRRARITKHEALFLENLATPIDVDTDTIELETDASNKFIAINGNWMFMRRLGAYLQDDNMSFMHKDAFRVTYNFPNAIRANVFPSVSGGVTHYGGNGWSYRLLYEYLCNTYNYGEYFVDTYFDKIFPNTVSAKRLQELRRDMSIDAEESLNTIRTDKNKRTMLLEMLKSKGILTNNNTLRDRKGRFASIGSPKVDYIFKELFLGKGGWNDVFKSKKRVYNKELKSIAKDIRLDIIAALRDGSIPLRRHISEWTVESRRRITGMQDSKELFYASGRLINSLQVYVQVDNDKEGK